MQHKNGAWQETYYLEMQFYSWYYLEGVRTSVTKPFANLVIWSYLVNLKCGIAYIT